MAVLRVPQDYETIRDATEAAKPGNTIVADSTYSAQEYVNIDTDDLTIGAGKAAQQITLALQGHATHLTLSGDAPIAVNGSEQASVIRGNAGDNVIEARSSAADIIDGGDGDDVIVGDNPFFASGGADRLSGGRGDDTFKMGGYVYNGAVVDGGDGVDTLEIGPLTNMTIRNVEILDGYAHYGTVEQFQSFEKFTYTEFDSVKIRFILEGSGGVIDLSKSVTGLLSASVEAQSITSGIAVVGSSSADAIYGSAYDDRIDGWKGADRLTGNLGNDLYIVDNRGDLVFEDVGGGLDTVVARVSYALQAGQEIESLRSGDDFGTAAIDLTGNEFAQSIRGTFGDNVLDGRGGADALYGYGGNDTYVVDNAGDQVFENRGGGIDKVLASTSYTLQAAQEIETLQITDSKKGALNLTGNEFAQTLIGNNGANVLDGQGGADTLIGRGGNDTYLVDNKADRVVEAVGGGHDTVIASGSYGLTAGQEIETLRLADPTGQGRATLAGNAFDNTIIGNAGNNSLDGGLGHDLLQGGEGRDTFVFSTALGPDNVDHIADFSHGIDTVRLAKSIFTALGAGALTDGAFKDLGEAGATLDADDRILYDHTTGDLSYDADGSGTAFAAVRFAVVDNHDKAQLGHADILIV